ncbi:PQQ-binding-like beta-propeller repeat protein [Ginsengibacter hankyongi]|uniref:PQQ-binding-like beta-propeller repeat protein n=2 Tax=Ginsengibacter hankyongi TaxID=2607284 RepID=A0A5J5IC75_9BACT|nr:PQQ-binding-like beta-propeller repeat protein [Ginsengibacter hankyongi]
MQFRHLTALFIIFAVSFSCERSIKQSYKNWSVYGGTKDAMHYSSLIEVDTSNVGELQVAWEYHTGDADTGSSTQIQCNPIIVNGVLYALSPKMKLFALDAATGKENWVFNPEVLNRIDTNAPAKLPLTFLNTGRGVSYWTDGKDDKRVFYTAGYYLICLNANTGKIITTFGENGHIDLHDGLGRHVKDRFITSNTPGVIYKDLLIMGSRVAEDATAAPGHIRAYNVITGKQQWIFHTIPQPGELGYDTYEDKNAWQHLGSANNWAGMSLDEKRGIVFVPSGSVAFDFYGGKRLGNNLFADCVVALDAATGKRIWHFQTVHHDLWDRDLPTAPILATITKDEKKIDAVVQITKSGFIFLFDRETGKPIYPVEEKQVPTQSELQGEKPSPTQPFPTFPKPFARQVLNEGDLNNLVSDSSYQDIKKRLASYKTGNIFNPPSKEGTIIFPGFDGGGEWGGPAYDPSTGIIYVNATEMPWILTMIDVKNDEKTNETYLQAGKRLYMKTCVACHGPERKGAGSYPSLINVNKKYKELAFDQLLANGRKMMPAFNTFSAEEKSAIASFILDIKHNQSKKFIAPLKTKDPYLDLPYTSTGYNKFLTKEGYPAVKPPWGTLTAINLNTAEVVWKDTLGDYPELKAKGIHSGTENYGGPVVTAGGLIFIAATSDSKIRAFNKRTGQLLWEAELPASGFATPAVYNIDGKEYLVIACGGGKLKTKSGDAYVAFALPAKK